MSLTPITKALAVASLAGLSLSSPTVGQDAGNFSGWHNGWAPGYMRGPGYLNGPGYMMGQGSMGGSGYMMGPGYKMGTG